MTRVPISLSPACTVVGSFPESTSYDLKLTSVSIDRPGILLLSISERQVAHKSIGTFPNIW